MTIDRCTKSHCLSGLDPRTVILLLVAFAVGLFFIDTLAGTLIAGCLLLGAVRTWGASLRTLVRSGLPAYPIALFIGIYNGVATGWMWGLVMTVRMVLLVWSGLAAMAVLDDDDMLWSLKRFLAPLGKAGLPVNDLATSMALALRFIPIAASEFAIVHASQQARGASLGTGGPIQRIRAEAAVFPPLFIGMFRRADRLALAMDSRCFGVPGKPTELRQGAFGLRDGAVLFVGVLAITLLAAID